MPASTMYADLSKLQRPWKGNSASLYSNLPAIAGQVMNQEEDDPYRKMLEQLGGDSAQAGGSSTRAAELSSRIQQAQRGGIAQSNNLKSMIPTEASAALAGGANKGYANSYLSQLTEIGKQGSAATARQQAINAFQNRNSGGGSGGDFGPVGNVTGWRAKAIKFAQSQLGVPYVWGGTSPGKGLDCSGLVQWAYGKAGIKLPRVSQQQMTRGRRTGIGNLVPGDLVGWGHPAHHIAIYLGGGKVLEAPRTGLNVRVISLKNKGGGAWGIHLNF